MASRRARFQQIASEARERTNDHLSMEISTLTPLTQDEIRRLLPTKADKEQMAELMAIVSASTSENEKVAALRSNIDHFGGVILRLLKASLLR